ncbi:putative MFS family arabinose efflux permease [Bacillus ectoiniformans]|nr:putative MFS family arabinose efflux permease [Bacillus ectoiniformans]
MNQSSYKEPLWTRSFLLLIIGNLFIFMSFQMLIPTLPPYFKDMGASPLEVGLVTTLFSIGAIISRPYIGSMLAYKERKMLVVLGAVSLLLITLVYPVTSIIFFLLAMRFVHGIVWGVSTTVNGTAAVDIVPDSRLGEGMGYFGLSMTVGMIIAPSLGIFLYQNAPFPVMIAVSAGLGLLAIGFLSIVSYRTPDAVLKTKKEDVPFSFFASLIEKAAWYPAFITLLATFGYGTVVTFIIIFSEERGLDQIFLFYLCNAIVATLIRPIAGKYFDRHGPKRIIIICSFLTFIAMWILSLATSIVFVVISGIMFGAGFGSLIPTLQSWVLSETPQHRRGAANGMFYSAIDLGIGLSGLVFGIIAQFTETAHLFQLSSIFFLLAAVLTLAEAKLRKEKKQWSNAEALNR